MIIGKDDGRPRVLDFGLAQRHLQVDDALDGTADLGDLGSNFRETSGLRGVGAGGRTPRAGLVVGVEGQRRVLSDPGRGRDRHPALHGARAAHVGGEVDARSDRSLPSASRSTRRCTEAAVRRRDPICFAPRCWLARSLGCFRPCAPGVTARVRRALLRGCRAQPGRAPHPDMSALLQQLGGDARRRLMVISLIVATAAAVTAAAVAVAMTARQREDACTGAAHPRRGSGPGGARRHPGRVHGDPAPLRRRHLRLASRSRRRTRAWRAARCGARSAWRRGSMPSSPRTS